MARLSEQEINDIRAKADIVDVLSRYISLTRKGKSYHATCPFHDDHDPSMSISQDKQIYKCFVCGAGGNVFSFVQRYENISFIEAVYKVAEYAGVQIEQELIVPEKQIDPHIAAMYKAGHDMIEFTHYQLDTPTGKSVKEYLYKRGMDDAIIAQFGLGYNPLDDSVYKFLHAKKHQDETLLASGIVRMTPMGIKDVFSNRITIPIHDAFGNPVGCSARRIQDNEDAKYINTSETEIYHKGDLIFNYHRAKLEARKLKKVFIVEGAMDVISLAKVDILASVATLGTACTKNQLKLLKQLGVDLIVCYDGDRAGKDATYKLGKLIDGSMPFTIVDNKLGLDPDEIIDTYGKDELKKMLNKTISWVDFLFDYLLGRYDLGNYSQKKEFAIAIADEIKKLKDDFEVQNYYIRLRELTGFDMQIKNEEEPIEKKETKQYQKRGYLTYPKSGQLQAEYEILSQMICALSASNFFRDELGFLKDDDCNKLAMYIIDYYRTHKTLHIADLLNVIQERKVQELLLSIASWELAHNSVNMDVLRGAITKMKTCLLDEKIEHLKEKAKNVSDPLTKAKIADERNQLIRERSELLCKEGS